jgi:hypothetical protein
MAFPVGGAAQASMAVAMLAKPRNWNANLIFMFLSIKKANEAGQNRVTYSESLFI